MNIDGPKIRKDIAVITSDRYKTPKTSALIFHFDPDASSSSEQRLKRCTLQKQSVEEKDLYIFDQFFTDQESQELRQVSEKATFSREIFADSESKHKGEEPARAMDNQEKWHFFSHPPHALQEIFKFLSWMAARLNADITTLPWELCEKEICAPAFATNRIERLSHESMELGKHDDYDTEEGIAFGIPLLYSPGDFHPNTFVNGATGKPWLVSVMLYATSEGFKPEYGLGTVFCKHDGTEATRADCQHMRFVLFEGNILHGIEASRIPDSVKPWRVSYVLKLVINPHEESSSMKEAFSSLMKTYKESR